MNTGSTLINRKYLPIVVTVSLFVLMYGIASVMYPDFLSFRVFYNLLIDNSYLGIIAIGETFVILTGGIDLSVASVIAMTTMISAVLLEHAHWSPILVIPIALAAGSALGFVMGCLIHFFKMPPFITTLAGLYFSRGICFIMSINSIPITNKFYTQVAQTRIHLVGGFVSINVVIFAVVTILAIVLAHYTKFGRVVYAIGGNEQSALLMGLPVGRTKVLVYTLSGFCSALAGVVFTFYILSGYGLHVDGMVLSAIAATVIGGTLLTGGVGYVFGTVFGTLILGTINAIIVFQGTLSSWWTKIATGALMFVFILFQALLSAREGKPKRSAASEESEMAMTRS